MRIVVTGATGFIGRRLISRLEAEGHEIRAFGRQEPSVENADAVVHLAGEPIAQRWTAAAKSKIRDSRVLGTRRLVSKLSPKTTTLICGSAVGIYGSNEFLATVCREWEDEATKAEALGIRVVRIRTGLVLGPDGGALARMLPPFRLGLGGRLGSGKQWMSWIHIDDLVGMICDALGGTVSGPVNGVSPNPVTNATFTAELARVLKRPAIFPVPEFALKLLFGEMSAVLIDSQRVLPDDTGYRFQFPALGPALRDILTR